MLTASGHPLALPPAACLVEPCCTFILPCTVFGYLVWFTALEKREAGEMSVFLVYPAGRRGVLRRVFLRRQNHDVYRHRRGPGAAGGRPSQPAIFAAALACPAGDITVRRCTLSR